MSCALLRLRRDGLEVRKSLVAPLALDPLADDPALVGREIQKHLLAAGIRTRRCVVALPARWVLTLRAPLPALSPADAEAYLQLQAERGFPYAPKDLSWGVSRSSLPGGELEAMLVALPSNHLAALERVLRAARLRPVSVTVGAASLAPRRAGGETDSVAVLLRETGLDLSVTVGGGLLALRALDLELAGLAESGPSADAILRELRITLGQAPAGLRERIRDVHLFGPPALCATLRGALADGLSRLGLALEPGKLPISVQGGAEAVEIAPAAAATAAHYLLRQPGVVELLPPRPSRLRQLAARVSTRSAFVWAGAAAVLVLAAGGAFFFQHWRLSRLESEWASIQPVAEQLEGLQQRIRTARPWFDDSIPSLVALRALTEAFPAEGGVWTRTVVIKDQSKVTCDGSARSTQQWLQMRDKLAATPGVEDLQVQQVTGDSPVQFRFSYRWSAGGGDGV